jgi:membrane fusion protein (multidrug efflux system)
VTLSRLKQILPAPKLSIPIAITTVLVIVAVVTLINRSGRAVGAATRPFDVEVVQVKQEDVPVYSEWIGTTEGLVNADIKAQVSGYLLRQNYKEGSFVKKGQLLFEIDPRPFQPRWIRPTVKWRSLKVNWSKQGLRWSRQRRKLLR